MSHVLSNILALHLPYLKALIHNSLCFLTYIPLGLHLMLKLSTAATRLPLVKPPIILKVYHSRSPSPLATQYIQFLELPRLPSIPPSPWCLGRAWAGKQLQRGTNREQLWGLFQNIWEASQRWVETRQIKWNSEYGLPPSLLVSHFKTWRSAPWQRPTEA